MGRADIVALRLPVVGSFDVNLDPNKRAILLHNEVRVVELVKVRRPATATLFVNLTMRPFVRSF